MIRLVLTWVVLFSLPALASKGPVGFKEKELAEVRREFKFRGKPIHPRIVHRLTGWPSESGFPTVVTIDLAQAAGSAEFPDEEVQSDGRKFSHKLGTDVFTYEWLGVVKSGTHVILATEGEEPPAVEAASGEVAPAKKHKKVMFLRAARGKAFLDNGKLYDRLLLTEERRYPLTEKEEVAAKIAGDKVTLEITVAGGKKRSVSMDIQ